MRFLATEYVILATLLVRLMTLFMVPIAVHAQAVVSKFEVTSVKPHAPNSENVPVRCSNGRLLSSGYNLYGLIHWAYRLQFPQSAEMDEQLPAWTRRADGVYDIQATSEGPVSEAQCRLMLQTLLADRFKFAAHWETKEGSLFNLVVAPGGHKLKLATDADTTPGLNIIRNGNASRTFPGAPVGISIGDLVGVIGAYTRDRLQVVDKTGLEGQFRINLAFSSDPLQFADPDLETALVKQLGLKLERSKGPVAHFVLDNIERPDSN